MVGLFAVVGLCGWWCWVAVMWVEVLVKMILAMLGYQL